MEPRGHEKIADRWLDAALKQYGRAEPRTGLEGRVLATLRAAKECPVERRSWWPAVVAVAAIAVVAGVIFLGRERPGAKKEMATVQAPAIREAQSPALVDRKPETTVVAKLADQKKRANSMRPPRAMDDGDPRLAQFPAPRPLTSQEQRLARYVQERPEEAKQVAQAQADLFRNDLAEFEKQYGPPEPPLNSSQ